MADVTPEKLRAEARAVAYTEYPMTIVRRDSLESLLRSAADRIEALVRERDLARDALRAVERVVRTDGDCWHEMVCAWCDAVESKLSQQSTHAPDCLRQRALGLTPEKEVPHDTRA